MIRDYDTHIMSLSDKNLDSLFLEYLNLPINDQVLVKPKT